MGLAGLEAKLYVSGHPLMLASLSTGCSQAVQAADAQQDVYKDLSTLHVQNNWSRSAHDQTGWRQLIASGRT